MDNPGQPPDGWLTLTEAATRTGHAREALRQRVRRGTLPATKGNDGVLRVQTADLADLPPPDDTPDASTVVALDVLTLTVADLRTDLGRMQTDLDAARTAHLDSHGRAERADARAIAAEARAERAEAALIEARTPWAVRLIRAWRTRS